MHVMAWELHISRMGRASLSEWVSANCNKTEAAETCPISPLTTKLNFSSIVIACREYRRILCMGWRGNVCRDRGTRSGVAEGSWPGHQRVSRWGCLRQLIRPSEGIALRGLKAEDYYSFRGHVRGTDGSHQAAGRRCCNQTCWSAPAASSLRVTHLKNRASLEWASANLSIQVDQSDVTHSDKHFDIIALLAGANRYFFREPSKKHAGII